MRRYRPLPAVVFAIAVSALVGGLFGRSALATDDKVPEHYKTFTAALSAIESSYVDKVESDRLVYGADPRHARHARSAFELLRPARIRADARAPGRALLRPRHHDPGRSTATSPPTSVFEGSPAYKKGIRRGDIIAKIDGEDAKGWTTEQAMRKLRGPKGTPVADRDQAARLRAADSDSRSTRDEVHIPTVPAVFHDRRDDRLHPPCRTSARTPIARFKRALRELTSKGMKRLLLRHPRQSRAARSIRRSRCRTSSCRAAR